MMISSSTSTRFAKNACRAIADLVEICQVLYFTCHPQTVADLVEAIPGAVVMDISK